MPHTHDKSSEMVKDETLETFASHETHAQDDGNNMPLGKALRKYPKVAMYSLFVTLAILLWGYDLVIVGTVSSIPAFQQVVWQDFAFKADLTSRQDGVRQRIRRQMDRPGLMVRCVANFHEHWNDDRCFTVRLATRSHRSTLEPFRFFHDHLNRCWYLLRCRPACQSRIKKRCLFSREVRPGLRSRGPHVHSSDVVGVSASFKH